MIVQDRADHILLITQPDHARLARRIFEQWPALFQHPRRDTLLLAIGGHDQGWADSDAAPLAEPSTGAVVDFVHAPLELRQRWAVTSVQRLAADSPWAAALVAEHGLTVYARYRTEPEWAEYFEGLTTLRDGLLRVAGSSYETLVDDYVFLRLADLVSLTFCTGWDDDQRFREWSIQRVATQVHVRPREQNVVIPFSITARRLAKTPYRSGAALLAALRIADHVTLNGELVA